jgi:hypothetical protein
MAGKGAKLALFFGLCWNYPGYPMSRDMGSALHLASSSTLTSAPTIYRKAKMSEVQFSDITIIGNSAAKAPRKEGKTKEGKDQFIITFSLSSNAQGPWIETFNRVWGKRGNEPPLLSLPMVRDDQIQIACPLDDQLQDHLDNLKQAVATTNQVYHAQLQATYDEKRNHGELLQKLRF